MKKNFIIPNIKIENFRLENIVLTSSAAPSNVETAQANLAEDYNVSINKTAIITL